MINFINTVLLSQPDSSGKRAIYYDIKNNRWTNNNRVRNRDYQVYRF